MALFLVRHGRVGDTQLDGTDDPPLSDLGRSQAEAVAAVLRADALASSPLRRAAETAAPIGASIGLAVAIVPAVGEVVPPGLDAEARRAFLAAFMSGRWSDQPKAVKRWRDQLLAAVAALASGDGDVVVVSHFVAINTVAGLALGDDRTTVFRPGNCSVSEFTWGRSGPAVVELGREGHLAGVQT